MSLKCELEVRCGMDEHPQTAGHESTHNLRWYQIEDNSGVFLPSRFHNTLRT
jgi:hypothetical protein